MTSIKNDDKTFQNVWNALILFTIDKKILLIIQLLVYQLIRGVEIIDALF